MDNKTATELGTDIEREIKNLLRAKTPRYMSKYNIDEQDLGGMFLLTFLVMSSQIYDMHGASPDEACKNAELVIRGVISYNENKTEWKN